MAEKMTKKDMFAIIETLIPAGHEYETELKDFIAKQVKMLDAKAEKARARAAIRKADGDELRATVEAALTDEWQTIADIMAMIDDETVTRAMVSARLGALVKAGVADKEKQSIGGKRTMHYKLMAIDE